jgi:putative transposase
VYQTFKYRLEPTEAQRSTFARFAGSRRFIYNWALAERIAVYERDKASLSFFSQSAELTKLKQEEDKAWLNEVDRRVLVSGLKDLDLAFQAFFRRLKSSETPGFPKFKKKSRRESFRYATGVKVQDNRVYLPSIGWVKLRLSRPVKGKICQATVRQDGEHWFVCLICDVPAPEVTSAPTDDVVGVDVGISSFAHLSDGTQIENPRFLERALEKLQAAQQDLSRKTLRSNRWRKQAAKVAKLHRKVRNSRTDFLHKTSTDLVKRYDALAVETLSIEDMTVTAHRNRSRAIADSSWGAFFDKLEYKTKWAGKHLVRVDRYYPSTQLCSSCGARKAMPTDVRTYKCDACGLVMDRDLNASLNLRAAGHAVLNARGEGDLEPRTRKGRQLNL